MKTSRRITSMIVALVFALTSMLSFTVFADDLEFSDVPETHTYYSPISNLVARGVINGYEDGTFKPEATITRAEFAKLLAVATAPAGMTFDATTTQFPDVADANSSSAWAIPYIAYAVGTKAINGYEDGTFRPTAPVSYGEVIKMIVCTMGYGDVVDKTLDPWYMGYVNVAINIGLTKNAYLNGAQPAPRGVVAQLIYNIDFCNKLNNTGFNENKDPIFIQGGGSGGGQDWDNSESGTGKLLGVFEYSLTGKALSKTDVLIGDTVYDIGDFEVETLKDMVGNTVSFKYSTMGRKTLTSIIKQSGMNKTFTLDDWQIADVSAEQIKYYENEDDKEIEETQKISLSDNLYVVYNGIPVHPDAIDADFIEDYLNVDTGSITLISNDGSVGSAEVAIVESYVTYYVSSVSKLNDIVAIYDKYSAITGLPKVEFDEYEVSSVKRITSKGGSYTDSTIDAISQKSVVSIAQPYGAVEGTNVIISTATINGSVKEMSSDYEYVKIGTEIYSASPYYRQILEGGADVAFSTGDSGKFYLDYQGRIVAFEKTESENPYGLLVRYVHSSGMDASYSVEIYNASGKFIQHPLKENVRINGDSVSAQVAINRLLNTRAPGANWDLTDKDGDPVNLDRYLIQPIRYKTTTSNGTTYVSEIECMDSDDYTAGNIVPAYPSSENFEAGEAGATLTYSKSGYSFKADGANKFAMSSKTVVFVVPKDITKTDSYRKTGYNNSGFEDQVSYRVEAYNKEGSNAEVVIYYPGTNSTGLSVDASTYAFFINSVTPAKYNETIVKKVTYYKAGSATLETKYIEDDITTSELGYDPEVLKSGDIVKMVISGEYITKIKPVYVDGELLPDTGRNGYTIEGHYIKDNYSSTTDYYQVILGVVYERDGIDFRVIPAFIEDNDEFDEESWEGFKLSDSVQYYKYDTKNNEYIITSEGEIMSYYDMDDSAKEDATKVLAICRDKKVVAVLIVE